MSDQTPPPDQPTSPPAEGDDGGVGQGATPPPPPPAEDTAIGDAPPPPAPAKKSRLGLILTLVVGLVVLAIVAVVAVVFVVNRGEDKHSITIPATAGGMKRDKAKETELQQQLDATDKQLETQFKGTSVKHGLYNQDDTKRGPKSQLLFVGFKFKTPSETNATKFIAQLNKLASANQLKVTKISTGDAGGKAVCLGSPSSAAQQMASCLWATNDSAGALFPNAVGYDAKQLSKIMLDLRPDVEKTE
jgi:flagellar basal body-associated protein FliL